MYFSSKCKSTYSQKTIGMFCSRHVLIGNYASLINVEEYMLMVFFIAFNE